MPYYRIVNTDNFNGDYPAEHYVEGLPALNEDAMRRIAAAINKEIGHHHDRFYQVVDASTYKLQPGFEP